MKTAKKYIAINYSYINDSYDKLGSLIFERLKTNTKYEFIDAIPHIIPVIFNTPNTVDIIIDVSTPYKTNELIKSLLTAERYIPLIIGTTQHTYDMLQLIKHYSNFTQVILISQTDITDFDIKTFASQILSYCDWLTKQPIGFYTQMDNINIPINKYETCGYDFLIIPMEYYEKIIKYYDFIEIFIKNVCNRFTGIGGYGIIFINKTFSVSNKTFDWLIYNADGTIIYNNSFGALCCIQYLLDNNYILLNSSCDTYIILNLLKIDDTDYKYKTQIKITLDETIFVCHKFPKSFKEISYDVFEIYGSFTTGDLIKFPELWDNIEPEHPIFDINYIDKYNMNTINGVLYHDAYINIRTFELDKIYETKLCSNSCIMVSYALYHKFGYKTIYIKNLYDIFITVKIDTINSELYFDSYSHNKIQNVFNTIIKLEYN
jgi:hypothetical protein